MVEKDHAHDCLPFMLHISYFSGEAHPDCSRDGAGNGVFFISILEED